MSAKSTTAKTKSKSRPTKSVTVAPKAVAKAWPGAFGIYAQSKSVVLYNLGTIFWILLVSFAVGIVGSSIENSLHQHGTVSNFLSLVVGVWISGALTLAYLAGARSQNIEFIDSFKRSLPYYFNLLAVELLTAVLLAVSLLLFIVPFFFIAPRLAFARFYVLDKDMGPIDSLKASWHDSKGNVGKVWGIFGVSLLMAVLILVLVGIYFLFVYQAALTLLYLYVAKKSKSAKQAD